MTFSTVILSVASLAALGALIWLISVAFKHGQQNWGIALIVSAFIPFVGPIVTLVFIIKFWGIARNPAFLMLGSLCLAGIGFLSLVNNIRAMAQEMAENPEIQITLQQTATTSEEPPRTERDVPPVSPPPAQRPRESTATSNAKRRPIPQPEEVSPTGNPAVAGAPAAPTLPVPDVRFSPLTVDALSLGDVNPNQMRSVLARGRNTRDLAIREARLALSYFDARGLRLGRWMTVHTQSTNIVPAMATNEFTIQAFFVPQFTHDVRIEVESIRFANGERWPPIDPVLVQPDTNTP